MAKLARHAKTDPSVASGDIFVRIGMCAGTRLSARKGLPRRVPHGALRQGPRRRCSHPLRGQFLNYQFTSTITLVQEYRAVGCEDVTTVEIRLSANGKRGPSGTAV